MAPKAPKRRRDPPGPEGPQYGSLVRPTVETGEDPGQQLQCQIQILWQSVQGGDGMPRRIYQIGLVRIHRTGRTERMWGRVAVNAFVVLRAHRHRPHVQQWRDGNCVTVLLRSSSSSSYALPEGDYLVKWTAVEDKVRYIRWRAINTEDLREAIASIAEWEIRESGLDRALCRPMHKPHLAACMEFIRSFDGTQGTVRGEVIRIDAELICEVFGIPLGMDPLSSVIHHVHVRDWMPIRDDVVKRYVAHQCAYVGWALVLQAVSMVVMAGRRARCVSTHLLMYLQARFGTGGQKRTTKYRTLFHWGDPNRDTLWSKNGARMESGRVPERKGTERREQEGDTSMLISRSYSSSSD
ncbi:hypothetical protein R1sor_017893 [Riccia sorocarpa]|uniref:Uncharacterized protein n=1 Tax=Riccia sorocarpa TaxID=122646 RepID=A0ABD3I989_9MARC